MNREHLRLLLTARSLMGKGNDRGVVEMAAAAVGLSPHVADIARLLGAESDLVAALVEEDFDL